MELGETDEEDSEGDDGGLEEGEEDSDEEGWELASDQEARG